MNRARYLNAGTDQGKSVSSKLFFPGPIYNNTKRSGGSAREMKHRHGKEQEKHVVVKHI